VLRSRHRLVREGGKTALGDLKTPKSRRGVELTRAATEALRSHLKRRLEEMERIGSLYQPGGLVFAKPTGTLINPPISATARSSLCASALGSEKSIFTTSGSPAQPCCFHRALTRSSFKSFWDTQP
jgi:hypothetical protein